MTPHHQPFRSPDDLYASSPPWDIGRRLTRAEITTAFADGWRLDAIAPATTEVTIDPDGIRAWSVAATRN